MKTSKNHLLAVSIIYFLLACGGNASQNGNSHDSGDTETNSSSKKYNQACFKAFDYDYRQMLTVEEILEHVKVSDPGTLEVSFKESGIGKEHNEYSIKWPSDRPDMSMGVGSMQLPIKDDNIVAVDRLEFKKDKSEDALSSFNNAYKQYTEEDYRKMEERIDKEYTDKSEEERKVMKSMIRARENMAFHPVSNVGNAAYWEREEVKGVYFGTNLHVLAGTVQFRIKVKVGPDDKENARIAALLANEILAKCN